ncbi:MAG: (Fe-S)-binding protein [Peptococcaceae bacterium]|nr:MAG: (Fe-S)-binding protein [Peptococcaceae bacterium]
MEVIHASRLDSTFRSEVAANFRTDKDPEDFLNCLVCGMCVAGCPYYDLHDHADPRRFIRQVALGMREEVLKDMFIWACTMCGRCTMNCPMNVDIAGVVRTIRGNFGLRAPGFLQDVVDSQIKTGNQMDITTEEYLETLEWMEEELQAEVGDPEAKIPVDKEGADFLFLWDPREIKYYPQDVQNIAKIFWAAGANWTCSSRWWDCTHYALFNGNDEESRVLIKRYQDEYERLKVKELVVTECGHATRAQRWGRKVWLNGADYPVRNVVQLMAEWIEAGRLKLDSTRNPDPITFHDPCNLVRKEGIIEEPRYCIQQAVMDFREMWPNRRDNYCCGGGGGLLAMGKDIHPYRMAKGKLKAEQIEKTGAKVVCTPCHNCFDQLSDVLKHYNLDVKVRHVHHLVGNALVLPDKG